MHDYWNTYNKNVPLQCHVCILNTTYISVDCTHLKQLKTRILARVDDSESWLYIYFVLAYFLVKNEIAYR
jgi:hypothetical protein